MKQPQDGVPEVTARIASISSKTLPALPSEPEDARLTGMTRSLSRRMMGLNIGTAMEPQASSVAASTVVLARKPQVRAAAKADEVQVA